MIFSWKFRIWIWNRETTSPGFLHAAETPCIPQQFLLRVPQRRFVLYYTVLLIVCLFSAVFFCLVGHSPDEKSKIQLKSLEDWMHIIILQFYSGTNIFCFSFFLLQRVWTVWTKIMGVRTSAGRHPKVGLPVNVGLALNLPKTRRTANVGRWRLNFKCPKMSYFLPCCYFPEAKKST